MFWLTLGQSFPAAVTVYSHDWVGASLAVRLLLKTLFCPATFFSQVTDSGVLLVEALRLTFVPAQILVSIGSMVTYMESSVETVTSGE